MTWSPFFRPVTAGPTSTTTPAPSWPRIAGKSPSGSAPESVNASVWQTPVALISTRTSPERGPSRSTVVTSSGLPGELATAALTFTIRIFPRRAQTDETIANREFAFTIQDFEKNAGARRCVARGIGENTERQSGGHRHHRTESACDAAYASWIRLRAGLDDSRHRERERRSAVKYVRRKTSGSRNSGVSMNRIKDARAFGVNMRHPGGHLDFKLVARIHGRIRGRDRRHRDV